MPPGCRPRIGQALIAAVVALTACRTASKALPIQPRPSPIARPAAGPPARIAVIVMENEEYGGVVGSPSAPFTNSLARRYGLATGMYSVSHPSCCRLASGGHIATIAPGPGARQRARLVRYTDHYSVLQTIEDLFGLRRLRGAACARTPSLEPLLALG